MPKTMSTLTAHIPLLLSVSALLLLAAAPAAAAPDENSWGRTLAVLDGASVEAVLFGPTSMTEESIEGPSAQSETTAHCCDGSTVTCSGSYTEAQDAACPDEQGYCYGSLTGYRYCAAECCSSECPGPGPSCPETHGTPCSSSEDMPCSYSTGACGSCFCFRGAWKCS